MTLDGQPDRARAAQDARDAAGRVAALGLSMLAIDTGARPSAALRDLAEVSGARYIALPRAASGALAAVVSA